MNTDTSTITPEHERMTRFTADEVGLFTLVNDGEPESGTTPVVELRLVRSGVVVREMTPGEALSLAEQLTASAEYAIRLSQNPLTE